MAVINIYKFASLNANTDNTEKNPFGTGNPPVNETYLIKSILYNNTITPLTSLNYDERNRIGNSPSAKCRFQVRHRRLIIKQFVPCPLR